MEYRIREARIEVCNGRHCWHERRFIAERRITFLGMKWWWPVIDWGWRNTANEAQCDAEHDAYLRKPLTVTKLSHYKSD
jgi:hypothetical protein